MDKKNYFIYHQDRFMRLKGYFSEKPISDYPLKEPSKDFSRDFSSTFRHSGRDMWSARLSTGLFGATYCTSGNRGPKSSSEVLLAVGCEGLVKLINLGFITCPVCKPEEIEELWSVIEDAVTKKYGEEYDIHSLADFANKNILPFDARRVNWEEIVPVLGAFPNRMYVPQGLTNNDISALETRLKSLHSKLPEIGYLDKSIQPWQFVSYGSNVAQ